MASSALALGLFAVTAGLGALKGGGTGHLAVASVGAAEPGAAAAEALVAAISDASYVYRATKPSAPPAGKLGAVLRAAGVEVRVALPPVGFGDWNDLDRKG